MPAFITSINRITAVSLAYPEEFLCDFYDFQDISPGVRSKDELMH